jgi:hypothetical protein
LPEIAPREIEIRGELQLSFPALERQPLRGFASPPTIPSVPEGRTAYTDAYKQSLETLPESLPAPDAVSQPVDTPKPPKRGLLEMGGGRYVSRFVESRIALPLTTQQRLSFEVDYTGTNGYSPFAGADVETPADDLTGRVQFESRHDALTLRADVHGSADQYTLYGLPIVAQDTAASAPDRTALAGGAAAQLRTHGSVESSVRVSYDYSRYETELSLPPTSAQPEVTEGQLGFDGSAHVPIGNTGVHLDLSGTRSTFGADAGTNTAYGVDGGLAVTIVERNGLSVRAGGRFVSFDYPSASASFMLPQVRVEWTLSPAVSVYARNTPGLSAGSFAALYAQNPYAESLPSPRPTLSTTDAAAGFRVSLGPIQARTTAGYRYAPSYRYFFSSSGIGTVDDPFQVGYDSARLLRGGAELALQGITGVEASAGISVRNGTLVGDDDAIPYFSPVVADAMVSVSFADQRGLLQTTGTIESPRPVNRAETDEVRTYVSFDVEGSFEVTSLLDVVLRLQNLGPQAPKRWARYPQPPASVMGGFRIHW